MESAALKLFRKSDKESKGFIVKRDMQYLKKAPLQRTVINRDFRNDVNNAWWKEYYHCFIRFFKRMKEDIALTSEQLEIVFDTLDTEKNGYLTIDQFLKGFREYLVVSEANGVIMTDYLDDNIVNNNYTDELTATLNLIKGTNILKTSAEELEYISEQMKSRPGSQLSQWELFLKDLCHDLQTYKEAHLRLEKLMKQKEAQHQNYVRKMFEEVEMQLREEREKEGLNEQMKKKIKEEIKILQGELLMKDELLQQLNCECRELKQELVKSRKKEEKANYLNTTLMNQQNYYEAELEAERAKRDHIQNLLDNARRRFSFEKSQCFKDGFNLARRVTSIQEQGLLQQLQILEEMQRVLQKNDDQPVEC